MSSTITPGDISAFWLDKLEPKDWYVANSGVDDEIRSRFLDTWKEARQGGLHDWMTNASDLLSYIILTDQFPRNMFRDDGRAFATDKQAVAATELAVANAWDLEIAEPARQFIYVTLMHAEDLALQDRGVKMFSERMSPDNANLVHAQAHRWVIESFGRFPYRNAALGRTTTPEEQAFLDQGGYRYALSLFQTEAS